MATLRLPGRAVIGIRAANPGPFTLSGTNSWLVGQRPCWLVDPGPALDGHLEALVQAIGGRGGLAGILLTHDHPDHAEGVEALRARVPAPLFAARGAADVRVQDGGRYGPLRAVATPGHAPDHMAYVFEDVVFSGDAVLGEGSVFIAADPGALAGYLEGLRRLRDLPLAFLCPGHGPIVDEPRERIDTYIAHRLEREQRLVAALGAGARSVAELLDMVWDDAPAPLRPAAAVTLEAHLDKLEAEGRLPSGVERQRRSAETLAPADG